MTLETLVVYDVSTSSKEGERRLRQVARACEGLGYRVQNSVFELRCSESQLVTLTARLADLVDDLDSIRIYRLRRGTLDHVQSIGRASNRPTPGAVIA